MMHARPAAGHFLSAPFCMRAAFSVALAEPTRVFLTPRRPRASSSSWAAQEEEPIDRAFAAFFPSPLLLIHSDDANKGSPLLLHTDFRYLEGRIVGCGAFNLDGAD